MMEKACFLTAAVLAFLLHSCKSDHLIADRHYLNGLEADFQAKRLLAAERDSDLFSVFDKDLTGERREALLFLFSYMPLSDLADYNGEFFLANADHALRARNEASWGKTIPEEIFLHYVLPPRVNNENLDSFRIAYYNEISERINGMDAHEAALEINHWCHEKVEYQPSDIRTSGPVSTILSARGRCGEESTLAVAALRTAGLPARQVYTPRWAHCDDNHAWVEVWINGEWYYMGACEPEPVLDRGWFTEPARRAMLVHTKSFGAPFPDEKWVVKTRNFSLINNLAKYAPVKTIYVKVMGVNDLPVHDAAVEYQLYNYAEFYPLATVPTDINGISSFQTGSGDLLVWARKGDSFSFKKISVKDTDTLELTLGFKPEGSYSVMYDLSVPPVLPPLPGIPDSMAEKNKIRFENENRIRKEYRDTWMTQGEAEALALKTGTDSDILKGIISRSMGNFRSIERFLLDTREEERDMAMELLKVISDKDLRDIRPEVLLDHLEKAVPPENLPVKTDMKTYISYVLNPRIDNEMIVPWRRQLIESVPDNVKSEAIYDPLRLVSYIAENTTTDNENNYYQTPITPAGVDKLKVTDKKSRDLYFVALCRALGIPARLEPGSRIPQYLDSVSWHDVIFPGDKTSGVSKGFITLLTDEKFPEPEYYIHFTLARFENGRYNTLEYDYNRRISDFHGNIALEPGHYMLVTGNRLSDSRILSELTFFELKPDEHKNVFVSLRKENFMPVTLGKFDMSVSVESTDGTKKVLSEMAGRGMVIAWIDPQLEPSRHVMNDLPMLKNELDNWGGQFVFIPVGGGSAKELPPDNFPGLPARSIFLNDPQSSLLRVCYTTLSCSTTQFPLIVLLDDSGNVIYKSEGYRIGTGEQLLKAAENYRQIKSQ